MFHQQQHISDRMLVKLAMRVVLNLISYFTWRAVLSLSLQQCCRERGGNSFSNIAAALEAKYGKKSAKNGANGNKHEPTEEEFAAASARISKKRKDEPASSKAAAGKKNKRLVAEAAAGDERPEKRKKNGRRTAAA